MSYFKTCPNCGANLDPGERCDCVYSCTGCIYIEGVYCLKYNTRCTKVEQCSSMILKNPYI